MKELLGTWINDPEYITPDQPERVQMEFKDNGELIYTIFGETEHQIIYLVYRVENNFIITDQPSAPREERTKFLITKDDKLILSYGDDIYQYLRVSKN